jgi:hypothetical protein
VKGNFGTLWFGWLEDFEILFLDGKAQCKCGFVGFQVFLELYGQQRMDFCACTAKTVQNIICVCTL